MTEEKKKWKKETSAGGVVYKKQDDQTLVLLIMPMGRNFGPPEGYWTFPKGKIDEGEEKETTAIREVKEETGIEAKIVEELGYVKFFRNYDQTLKFVHYFLMKYGSGDPANHDKEVFEAKWVNLDQVESLLKWSTDKEIFEKAKKLLNS